MSRAPARPTRAQVRALRWRARARVQRYARRLARSGWSSGSFDASSRAPLSRDLAARADVPAAVPPAARPVKVVAFYLPQFHPIPENDQWWGEGFTEWTNVRRGRPVFPGHHQPHVPGDLGYYDLLDTPLVMHRQAQLARAHGVDAFCFYVYWFAGTRLLEAPVERFLADPTIDIEFCVCWANENWTRTWDGDAARGLIVQRHGPEDDLGFIEAMAPALRDPRALRVGGRPVLVVYRPALLPDPGATARRWRARCRELGIGEIALAYVRGFELPRPAEIGFDFSVEFPPPHSDIPTVATPQPAHPGYRGPVYDLGAVARRPRLLPAAPDQWRGVCPAWDNTARRPQDGAIMLGSTPVDFRAWFVRAGQDTIARFPQPSDRLVWVNAWNEWAEGAHLEPDLEFGYQWLHAIRDGQEALAGVGAGTGPGVVLVLHDLHRHGAQLLGLAMYRWLRRWGVRCTAVALGDGELRADVESVGPVDVVDDSDAARCRALAARLAAQGFTTALANSSVTGRFAAHLRAQGVHVTGLVHELPEVLAERDRGPRARAMAGAADVLVFPAASVRDRFPFPAPPRTRVEVAPQGLSAALPGIGDAPAREALRRDLGVPARARVVVGAGYGDWRKGFDLFCATLSALVAREGEAPVHAVWLGRVAREDPRMTAAVARAPAGRLHTPGFVADVAPWLRGADAFLLASREDPFPSVVLEALAAGLAVVARAGATGLSELLAACGGVEVDPGDPEGLAAACARAWAQDPAPGAAEARRSVVRERHDFHRWMLDVLALTPAALPRVSVLLPIGPGDSTLGGRLENLAAQTLPPYEVLAVRPGELAGAPQEGAERLGLPWVRLDDDQWLPAVRRARGEVVWWLGCGEAVAPTFLAEVLAGFGEPGRVVLSACRSGAGSQAEGPAGDPVRRTVVDAGPGDVLPVLGATLFDRAALLATLEDGLGAAAVGCCGERVQRAVLGRGRLAWTPRRLHEPGPGGELS